MAEVPLSPVGREEIHRLEAALLIASLFSREAIEELRNPEGRLTWVDSLAVAAAALARERAKMPVTQIAEELGRTEATIRAHLSGRTKAGKLVRETYERFLKEGVKIEVPELFRSLQQTLTEEQQSREVEELRNKVQELEAKVSALSAEVERLRAIRSQVLELLDGLERTVQQLRATVSGS